VGRFQANYIFIPLTIVLQSSHFAVNTQKYGHTVSRCLHY